MTEDARGDNGCSVGQYQWNHCARGTDPAGGVYERQVDVFLDEMEVKNRTHDFYVSSVSWNKPVVLRTGSYKTKYYYDVLTTYNRYVTK